MTKQIIEGANGYLYDVEKDTWNKPMKLYTEEEVRNAMQESRYAFNTEKGYDEILNSLTPIELPNNEKINKAIKTNNYDLIIAFNAGANWVIKQILNQNK